MNMGKISHQSTVTLVTSRKRKKQKCLACKAVIQLQGNVSHPVRHFNIFDG